MIFQLEVILLDGVPPSTTYYIPSDIHFTKGKGKVFSFGISRQAFAKVFFKYVASKENPPSDPTIPGPGSYDVKALIGKITQRFTLRPKTNFDSTLIQTI